MLANKTPQMYSEQIPFQKRNTKQNNNVKSRKQQQQERIENLKFAYTLVGLGVVVFVTCLCYINQFVMLAQKQRELIKVSAESRDLTSKISSLQAKMTSKYDLDTIQAKAIEMGYVVPAPYQIVYIDIPQTSYTTYAK